MAWNKPTYSDYQRILGELKAGQLKPFYFCMGADHFLYRQFLSELRAAFTLKHGDQASIVQRWGVDLKEVSHVSSLMGGGGLFSTASLVMLHEIQDSSRSVKPKLAELLSNPPADTIVMAHYSLDESRKAKWIDNLNKAAVSVPLTRPEIRALPPLVEQIASSRGLQLDQQALLRLIELSSGELAIIENELEKISLFLPDGGGQVDQKLVNQVAGSVENAHVFQFIEAISHRDRETALRTLVEIHHQGKEGLPYLVAILYNRLTQLMALRETPEARKSINQASTSGYFLRQLSSVGNNYSLSELQSATRHLAELDLRFRLGSMDLLTSFSTWISKVV